MRRFVPLICVLALGIVTPVLAKEKNGKTAPGGQVAGAANLTDPILADAIRLCQLVADDDGRMLDVLEADGWAPKVDREIGNAPYYKEITAQFTYENVGDAEIWGFVEGYPEADIGYCSFSITNPEVRFSISAINGMEGMVGQTKQEGEQVYGAWNDVSAQPSVFIHAYHNIDTFTYQVTRINRK